MLADSEMTNESEAKAEVHPLFASVDADVVLGSKERTLFRMHSYTLRTTSGWFRTMFSLPGQRSGLDSLVETIYLDEGTAVLEGLFRMVAGLPIPTIDSFDTIEPLLQAAEKYEMPGPQSIVRALLMTQPFLADPLRLYGVACRYGWLDEARAASRHTLTLNLHAPEHRAMLLKLSTPSLLSLIELHRRRREALRRRLDDPPFVSDYVDTACSHCLAIVDYRTWRELKYVIIMEMDERPLGDTITEHGLTEWPSARYCWDAKCDHCGRVIYDKKETLRVIKDCIDQLPSTIEDSETILPIV